MQNLIKFRKIILLILIPVIVPILSYIVKAIFNLGVISGSMIRFLESIC